MKLFTIIIFKQHNSIKIQCYFPTLRDKEQSKWAVKDNARKHKEERANEGTAPEKNRTAVTGLLCKSPLSKNSPDLRFKFYQKPLVLKYHWRLLNFHQGPNRKHLFSYLKVSQLIKSMFALFLLLEA